MGLLRRLRRGLGWAFSELIPGGVQPALMQAETD
jgi:hypothetical protein